MILLLAMFMTVGAPLGDGEVHGVVDGWLAAQNAGDFAAYDKLFAARFMGVRRSGPRTVRFDRAGWMKDRARMFKKPMTVAIGDVTIRTGGPSALVSFTQTFAQGNYKDSGPKQLVIVREAGALKIASERMLRSLIESAPVPADERFRFVVSGGVLLSETPDLAWGTGAITYDGGAPAVAERRVDARKLPAALARWQGRRIRLVTASGVGCETKIDGFRLLSRSFPHFGTRQEWTGMKASEVAREAWDLGATVLVALPDSPCDGAFWAQPIGQPAPDTDAGQAADVVLTARALVELRKTDAWKEIQKSYLESPSKGVKRWDGLPNAKIDARRFRARLGGKEIKLVLLTVRVDYPACDEFGATLWGLYEERAGKLIPRNTPGIADQYPIATVDSDGDGNSELLMQPFPDSVGNDKGRLLLDGELWDSSDLITIPYMDCDC